MALIKGHQMIKKIMTNGEVNFISNKKTKGCEDA